MNEPNFTAEFHDPKKARVFELRAANLVGADKVKSITDGKVTVIEVDADPGDVEVLKTTLVNVNEGR